MPSGPKTGTGAYEVFLLDEIGKLPPTSISTLKGAKMSVAVPSASNAGDAIVDVRGRLRQTATSDPTLEIRIPHLGRAQGSRIGSGVGDADTGIPVPRFAIKRSDYDQQSDDSDWVGQSENFYTDTDWSKYLKAPSAAGSNGNWIAADLPKMCVNKDDKILYLVILSRYTTPTPDQFDIIVYKHDPAVDTAWTFVADVSGNDLQTLVGGTSGFEMFGIAPCVRNGVLYIFGLGYSGSESTLYTFRISGSDVILDAETDEISPAIISYNAAFNGMSADADDQGFVVAISGLSYPVTGGSPTNVVQVCRSPDGQTWTTRDEDPRFIDLVTLGEFSVVHKPRGNINSIHFYSTTIGYAVTNLGEIFKSTDGGASWTKTASPVESQPAQFGGSGGLELQCVRAVSATVAYACGRRGLVLKTTDAGVTWKAKMFSDVATDGSGNIVSQPSDIGQVRIPSENLDLGTLTTGATNPAPMLNRTLTSMAWASASIGWVVGEGGVVYYTGDGGSTWTTIQDWKTSGWLTGVTIESYSAPNYGIIVSGLVGVFNNSALVTNAKSREAVLCRIPAAQAAAVLANCTYMSLPGRDGVISMQKSTESGYSSPTYCITDFGLVYKRTTGDGWVRVGTTNKHQKFTGWRDKKAGLLGTQLESYTNFDTMRVISDECVLVFGNFIYRSQDSGDTWTIIDKPDHHAGSGYFFDEDTGVAGGRQSISYALNIANDRLFTDTLALGGGRFLVSLSNRTIGRVELYLSTDGGRSFTLVDSAIEFAPSTDSTVPKSVPQTSLTIDEYGYIILSAGIGRGSTVLAPSAPTGTAHASPGDLPAGTYRVAISTRDTTTLEETALSPYVEVTNGAAFYITVDFSAAGTGRETLIYGTDTDGKDLFLIGTVGAAVTTFQYDDLADLTEQGPVALYDGGRVCTDGLGLNWVGRKYPGLSFPVGKMSAATETAETMLALNNTRYTKAFFGRLFSLSLNPGRSVPSGTQQIKFHIARQFDASASPSHYPPITGRPQYAGVDDVSVAILGDARAGDEWTISPEADYPSQNFSIESPSAVVKARNFSTDFTVTWDAQDADITALRGYSATHFMLNGIALFNTNFWRCILRISRPSWDSATFPTDADDYVEFELTSTVQTVSSFLPVSDYTLVSNKVKNVLRVSDLDLTPGCYKPGMGRVYYVYSTTNNKAYRIIDNDRDSITIDNDGAQVAGGGYIFGNQFFSKLSSGSNVGGAGTGVDLSTTQYRNARLVRLIVPASTNVIYGDEPFIGAPIIGKWVTSTGKSALPNEMRHRFSQGYGWTPRPATIESIGPSHVSVRRNLGTGQRFLLPYDGLKSWDRDMIQAGFGDNLRQSFAFVMDGGNQDTAYLVTMTDGADFVNLAGDRYSAAYELVQLL